MLREFFCAGSAQQLLFAWTGLVVFLGHAFFKAWLKWALNGWYAKFYDELQDLEPGSDDPSHMATKRQAVWDELVEFVWIVAPAVIVHPTGKWIASMWRFTWRMALVNAYLVHYDVMCPAVEGTAQRIQEDTLRFEGAIYSCVTMVLDSVLTLFIFVPVLLDVGAKAHPPNWDWPPWLLSIACSAAWGGLAVSMCVGRRLVVLDVENQKAEAAFRTKLVMLEQNPATVVSAESVPTDSNDDGVVDVDEPYMDINARPPTPRPLAPVLVFTQEVRALWGNYINLFRNFFYFNTWIGVYDQVLIIVPYILVAPMMFADDPANRISLGTLMKVTNAFDKVFGAMAIVTENWNEVNEFRSVVRRLGEFERAVYTRRHFDHTLLRDAGLGPSEVAVAEVVEMNTSSTWGEPGLARRVGN
tara:strand:- start:97 stop:1338 length:1242 start_codon:yes stop_codon:yes gene_type:complete